MVSKSFICIALMKNHPSVVSEFMLKVEDSYLSTVAIAELYNGLAHLLTVGCVNDAPHNRD
jgi:hypothetical protein